MNMAARIRFHWSRETNLNSVPAVHVLLAPLNTTHRIYSSDSRDMAGIPDATVDLVVTSPPYPMIEMWDGVFTELNPEIGRQIDTGHPDSAYSLMHGELEKVWAQAHRVLKPGGIACINIGDATRTIGGEFRLYPSHSTVSVAMAGLDFHELPSIIWKKQANSPNKFLGSGTMPPGAYVTLEHEYILIFRKPPRRRFTDIGDKEARSGSSYFWEERNAWFTDIWDDIKGMRQDMPANEARKRSAAFPFEVPYRLINMFSVIGDTVLDPFMGTGTTMFAAMASMRNSIGVERESELSGMAVEKGLSMADSLNRQIRRRLAGHLDYVNRAESEGHVFSYFNANHGFRVKTRNEKDILIRELARIIRMDSDESLNASYSDIIAGKSP